MSDTRTNRLVLRIDGDGKGAADTLKATNDAAALLAKTLQTVASGKTALAGLLAISPATLASQKNGINLLIAEERGRAAVARTATQEAAARAAVARATLTEEKYRAASARTASEESKGRATAARAATQETNTRIAATRATIVESTSRTAAARAVVTENRAREASVRVATQESNQRNAVARAVLQENNALASAAKVVTQENNARTALIRTTIQESNARAAVARATAAETRAQVTAERAAERKTRTPFSASIGEGVASGLIGGNVALAAASFALDTGKRAIELAGDTEEALNVLGAQSHATQEQMKALGDTARALGADVSLPATSSVDAARAMLELSKGGLSLDNTMKAAKGSLQLAAVASIDQADAARITANALNVFGLAGEEATRVTDLLVAASINSGKSIPEIADALRSVGSTARAAKIPIEDTLTSIALLGKAGLTGEMAGTALRQSLLKLAGSPSKEAAKELKNLGVSMYEADGSSRSLRDIINDLSRALASKTDRDRNHALAVIFGTKAIQVGNILLSKGTVLYDEMAAKVTKSGEAARIAEAKQKGLNGALDGFHSAIDSILEKRATPLLNFFSGIVRDGGKAADVTDRLTDRLAKLANTDTGKLKEALLWLSGLHASKDAYSSFQKMGSGLTQYLDKADADDKEHATPRYKAEQARGTLADISGVEAKVGTPDFYIPRSLSDKLRGYGVNLDQTDLTGKQDVGGILRQARPILEQIASANASQDNQSRLMGAYGVTTPGKKKTGKPAPDPADQKDIDAAAKALASANAEHIQILLDRALKTYQKSGNAGDRARVASLASALREKHYAEADAAAKADDDKKHPLLAEEKRRNGREHANDQYNETIERLKDIGKQFGDKAEKEARQSAAEAAKGVAETAKKSYEKVLEFYKTIAYLPDDKRSEVLARLNNRRRSYLDAEGRAKATADAVDGDSKGKMSERNAAMGVLATDTRQKITDATTAITAEIGASKEKYTAQTEKNAELQADIDRKRIDANITSLGLDLEETRDLEARKALRVRLLSAQIDRIMAEKASADAQVNHDEAAAKAKTKGGQLTPGQVAEFNLRRDQNGVVSVNAINAVSAQNVQAGKGDVRDDAAQQSSNFRQRADAAQNLTDKLNLLSEAQAQERIAAGPQSKAEYDAMLGKQYEETNGLVIQILEQQANIALLQAATTGDVAALKTAFRAFDLARMRALGPDGLAKQQHDEISALGEAANTPGSKLTGKNLQGLVSERIAGIRTGATASGNVQLANEADKAGEKFKRHINQTAREFGREVGSGMESAGARLASSFLRGDMRRGNRENALKQIGGELAGGVTDSAGKTLSHELGKGVTNEWRRVVRGDLAKDFASIGKNLKDSLAGGGKEAGGNIAGAAMLLASAASILGKNGKKKQLNTILGAGLGLGLASVLPGVGNLAGLGIGSVLGGMFADGGRYPIGRDILVGERGPEIVRINKPGEIIPNHKVGDYLDLANLMPTLPSFGGMPSLAPSAVRALQNVAATVASGGSGGAGGYGDIAQSITIFGGVHGDKAMGRAGKTWGSSLQDAVAMR